MIARMLVTLDGTRKSEAVIPYALETATRLGIDVTLLRIVDSEQGEDEFLRAEEYLVRVAELFAAEGLDPITEVRRGKAQEEILKSALAGRCDLIVMATRATHGVKRLILGSVAEEVLRQSYLPVLLVKAA